MKSVHRSIVAFSVLMMLSGIAWSANANAYREKDKAVEIGKSSVRVTPPRDWNRLNLKPGKYVEVWTLDGEQLNEVSFYGGVETGQPLIRERNAKRDPLPKFRSSTLAVEIPELLSATRKGFLKISHFTVTSAKPGDYLGRNGVHFTYEFTDDDNLPRLGEARATIIGKKLYMATYEAPRINFFDRNLSDFRLLIDSAKLPQ